MYDNRCFNVHYSELYTWKRYTELDNRTTSSNKMAISDILLVLTESSDSYLNYQLIVPFLTNSVRIGTHKDATHSLVQRKIH